MPTVTKPLPRMESLPRKEGPITRSNPFAILLRRAVSGGQRELRVEFTEPDSPIADGDRRQWQLIFRTEDHDYCRETLSAGRFKSRLAVVRELLERTHWPTSVVAVRVELW